MITFLIPLIGGVIFAIFPPDLFSGDPAKLLMPFLGLFMAGIFPAMSLTINSLKSGGFSVRRVLDLGDELRKLLNYLQALFLIALVAALTVITAETVSWGNNFHRSFYTARIFNIILGVCLSLLLGSLPRIRRTFSVLLKLGRDIAIDEASTKIKDRMAKIPSAVDRFPTKEKFGELFDADKLKKID